MVVNFGKPDFIVIPFIVGFLLCPTQLNVAGASDLWKQALQDSFVIPLVRDEVFFIHSAFESVLNNSKDKKYVCTGSTCVSYTFHVRLDSRKASLSLFASYYVLANCLCICMSMQGDCLSWG